MGASFRRKTITLYRYCYDNPELAAWSEPSFLHRIGADWPYPLMGVARDAYFDRVACTTSNDVERSAVVEPW